MLVKRYTKKASKKKQEPKEDDQQVEIIELQLIHFGTTNFFVRNMSLLYVHLIIKKLTEKLQNHFLVNIQPRNHRMSNNSLAELEGQQRNGC